MNNYSERLIFGCCNLSANETKKKALAILNYAEKLGFRFFDTAPLYSKGYSELLLSEAFKYKKNIKVITKVGYYSIPKIYIPSSIALPLNTLKTNFKLWNFKKSKNISHIPKNNLIKYNNFINQVKHSRKSLKDLIIEGILFHEINPFKLNNNQVEELNIYLNNINIKKLGYAGKFHKELNELNFPNWMKILQIEIPLELNETKESKILKLIDKNKDKEFRFFNIFKEKKFIDKRMNTAKKILNDFPNTKIIFQTKSLKRLENNFLFFTS